MRREYDETVRRFMDGELGDEEERELLHRIAEVPDARAFLRFDARLRGALSDEGTARGAVPPGFTARVMAAIEAREAAAAGVQETAAAGQRETAAVGAPAAARDGDGEPGWLGWLWEELTRPRTLVLRPAHTLAGAAVAAAAVALFILVGIPRGAEGPGETDAARATGDAGGPALAAATERAASDSVLVRFVFTDAEAETVAVAGDFSRWEPIPLVQRRGDGRAVWSGIVAVPRGEHRYMFVVDGNRWVTDPLATAVRDDGFGNRNAILSL